SRFLYGVSADEKTAAPPGCEKTQTGGTAEGHREPGQDSRQALGMFPEPGPGQFQNARAHRQPLRPGPDDGLVPELDRYLVEQVPAMARGVGREVARVPALGFSWHGRYLLETAAICRIQG